MKYRRFIISVFMICIIFFSVNSQRFDGGFTSGFCLSQVDGDTWSGYNKIGIVAGGFVNTKITERMKAQYEVKYIQKGARQSFDPKNPDVLKSHLEYLEMPVTLNYSLKSDSFLIETGLLLARLIRSRAYDSFGETALQNPYHKFDFGVIIGGSYNINKHIRLNIRYTYSILRIRKIEEPLFGWWWYYRGDYNNVISASIYYQF